MSKEDKKSAKKELIATLSGKTSEPKSSGLVFSKTDLIQALSFYSAHAKHDSLKAWALSYLHKNHPELVERAQKAKPYTFTTYGALCRLSDRGYEFDSELKERIRSYFEAIVIPSKDDIDEEEEQAPKAKPTPKKSRSFEALELAVDCVLEGKPVPTVSLISTENLKDVEDNCRKNLIEMNEAPEYYKAKSLPGLKKLYRETLDRVEKMQAATKVQKTKVVRARKVNPVKVVQGVKYQRSEDSLGLKSINPVDTLGQRKMYVYDSKYRKLILLIGTAAGFTFTGTTLKNVDLSKSSFKTLRKPEELKGANSLNISDLHKLYSRLTTKESAVTAARFNENWLIIKTAP